MASHRSAGTAGTASTAGAFRDVQAKVDAMRTELEERQSEVAKLQKEVASVRAAAQRSAATLENEWREKVQVMVEEQDEALGRQQAFVDQLSSDVHKLKEKRGELDDGVERIARRREDELEAARAENVDMLKREREQWVTLEKERLAKLALSRESSLKADAVKALEPTLHGGSE